MLANPKFLFFGLLVTYTLSGCGVIEIAETPKSWGANGGSYGAKQWIERQGSGVYPSSDSVALYCVSVGETGQKKFNWTFEQQRKSTDACAEAFLDGLR